MAIIKKDFSIEGMHCDACAIGIKMLLDSTDGIKSANINWGEKLGTIEYDESKIKIEEIQKTISDIGYSATLK
ncbi:MAG: heavy metal-associated domain-containing protein [Patescibacteria group bacterium]